MRERGRERWNGRGPAAVRDLILLSQDKPILSLLFALYLLSCCPEAYPSPTH